mmetsp:Transcript_5767/g.16947  ORF Transcript_5767/g.16947 Transcript_5767/m.16947 type:complete len:163 (+) Transcript_5767:2164-2652(+)
MPPPQLHQKKKKAKCKGRPFDESFNDGQTMDTEPTGMDDIPSPLTVRRSDASNVPRYEDGTFVEINPIRFSPVPEVVPLGLIVSSEIISTERGEGGGKILYQAEHESNVYDTYTLTCPIKELNRSWPFWIRKNPTPNNDTDTTRTRRHPTTPDDASGLAQAH